MGYWEAEHAHRQMKRGHPGHQVPATLEEIYQTNTIKVDLIAHCFSYGWNIRDKIGVKYDLVHQNLSYDLPSCGEVGHHVQG